MSILKYNKNELINFSSILSNESILVLDDDTFIFDNLEKMKISFLLVYCNPGDFRTITLYPSSYMNFFDVVICPDAIYNIKSSNRQMILQCIAWAMKPESRLIFSIPNIRIFNTNKAFINKYDNCKYLLKEHSTYYILKEKSFFSFFKKEYWHKTTLCVPTQIFKVWNSENAFSKWDINNISIKECGDRFLYMIKMKKSINHEQL